MLGSSPLTRGAPDIVAVMPVWEGLFPAHAGSTRGRSSRRCAQPAHPRSRGEHGDVGGAVVEGEWLIPAHAGSTSPRPGCGTNR